MIDSKLRDLPQRVFFDPLARSLSKFSITPLQITGLATLTGLTCALLISTGSQWIAALLLLLSGLFDVLDGSLARINNSSSDIGSVSDILSDRLIEACVCIGFYFYAPDRALYVILMLSSILLCVSSFLVVGIFTQNSSYKSFHYSPGLMERTEAFLFFLAMILLPTYFNYLSVTFSILVMYTAVKRYSEFSYRAH